MHTIVPYYIFIQCNPSPVFFLIVGQLRVIDLSLLVGVKKWTFPINVPDAEIDKSCKSRSSHALAHPDSIQPTFKPHSVTGPAMYYFGIVDFLQDRTFNKQIARTANIYLLRKDPDGKQNKTSYADFSQS